MPYTVDGSGAVTWLGTVTFAGSNDPLSSGIATLTLTPSGGVSNLQALIDGQPGLPPTLRNVTVHQVASGTTPPGSSWTLITPGSSGTASVYDLDLYVNSGATGTAGTNATISAASDLSAAATDKQILVYNASTGKWDPSSQRTVGTGPWDVLAASFSTPYNGNAGSYVVASVGTPALPFAWRPRVYGHMYAGGTANTQVDLVARLNSSTSGDIVGYGLGSLGATPPPMTLIPHFGASITGGSTYGLIAAGATATIYLLAQQVKSTNDNWTTDNTNAHFTVEAIAQ